MRPPPEGGGYKLLDVEGGQVQSASMRPPPEGGGYRPKRWKHWQHKSASMRPPPEGGGYTFPVTVVNSGSTRFNEAAARGRRILGVTEKALDDMLRLQ